MNDKGQGPTLGVHSRGGVYLTGVCIMGDLHDFNTGVCALSDLGSDA